LSSGARVNRKGNHCVYTFPLISPSAYYACREAGVAVVQTLHNFRLLCPGAMLLRQYRPCEDCVGRSVAWPALLHRCYRESGAATAVAAGMVAVHPLFGTWTRMIDVYIALTEHGRGKFVAGGLPPDRIVVKPNFVHPDPGPGVRGGGFALFVGRLSPEKRLETLMRAWDKLGARVPLKIAGTGPLEGRLREWRAGRPAVHLLGPVTPLQVQSLMKEAKNLIAPSVWYETFLRVLVEAFAAGLPVVASRLGAMAEIVEDGVTGLLCEPGDSEDLADRVRWVFSHPADVAEMGKTARLRFLAKYGAEQNYETLQDIYDLAVRRSRERNNRKRDS